MKRLVVIGVVLMLAVVVAACGGSSGTTGSSITVSDAWVRNPPISDQPDAAYLVIQNNGAADKLLSVDERYRPDDRAARIDGIGRHDADVARPEHSDSGQRQSGVEARRLPHDVDRPDAPIEDRGQGAADVEL